MVMSTMLTSAGRIQKSMRQYRPILTRMQCFMILRMGNYERWREVGEGVRPRYWNSDHIAAAVPRTVDMALDVIAGLAGIQTPVSKAPT